MSLRSKLVYTLLALSLVSCESERIYRISAARQPLSLLLCIADNLELWDSSIRPPEVVWAETGLDAFNIFSAGNADLTITNVSTFVPQLVHFPDVVILSEVYNSSRGTRVVVRKSLNIQNSRGLAGKRIGYVEGTSAEIFLEYFLLTEGVNLGGVKKFSMDLTQMKKAFNQGEIDAMVIWEPELSRFKKQYKGIPVVEFRSFVHEFKGVLLARSKMTEGEVAFSNGVLKTLIRAEQIYWDKPEESFTAYQLCLGGDTDRDVLKESLVDARGEVKLTNSLRQNFERNREWLILRKGIPLNLLPTFTESVRSGPLREIRARAVTLGGTN